MTAATASRWLSGSAGADTGAAPVRLFCFAHAGGGSAAFRPWRLRLAPRVDLRAVVLPGRESRVRELPYRRVEQLLDPLCAALEPHLDRPFALFGHSLGSVLAFEVARRVTAAGRPPALLAVSGRRAPHLPDTRRRFSELPDDEFLAAVGELGGTPSEVLGEGQLLRLLLPALRADFELNESYRPLPGPPLDCPVAAYTGAVDPEVDPGELLAWRERTTGEFTARVFPGGHFYLDDPANDVLGALGQDLLRAVARSGPVS